MNKKQLRYALNKVLHAAEYITCEDLHHPKKHQHGDDELCKAKCHVSRQINLLREYMKEQGI